MKVKYKALLFDLDNTLYDAALAYRKSTEAVGYNLREDPYKSAKDWVKQSLPEKNVNSHNRLLYFKRIFSESGKFSAKQLLDKLEQYEASLVKCINEQWVQLNRRKLFKKIKEHYSIAILTNEVLRTQLTKICAFDPDGDIFNLVITSEDVGREKPDPKMFESILSRLGLAPNECLMIGDSLDDDIRGAQEYGIDVIWTTEFLPKAKLSDLPMGAKHIERLADLPGVLGI